MQRVIRTTEPDVGFKVFSCGGEQCAPGHAFGPAMRDHYLIHFVASGKGILYADGHEYAVGAGQGFIIFPDEITTYSADMRDPWSYNWVGYAGERAAELTHQAGLSAERRVFSCLDAEEATEILHGIARDARELRLGEMAAAGGLMRFMARVSGGRAPQDMRAHRRHYENARRFMDGLYTQGITVEDVAAHAGLSRSQLYRVFETVAGRSPKEILTELRLRHARRLLEDTDMTVEEIAASAGFASAQRLGVVFRTQMKVSPTVYRQQMDGKK